MLPPSKKRRLAQSSAVEEVTFDPSARQEYLTGFHKRKVQRAKHAAEIAEKRARAEKIQHRKKIREERAKEIEERVRAVNAMLRPAERGSEDEVEEDGWEGLEGDGGEEKGPVEEIDHEAEYVDEEKYTTVTVEAMDVSKTGLIKATTTSTNNAEDDAEDDDDSTKKTQAAEKAPMKKNRKWTKDRPKDPDKKKKLKKKRNFKYENKAERKDARSKQKARNSKQARERRDRG
jgi:ribosomal RNA-processing protein 17